MILANAAVGLWALGAHRFPALRRPALWWCTAAAQVGVFVEVALGVATQNAEDLEPGRFHAFYGFVALVAIGILYSYRAQLKAQVFLLYGFGGLFVMGLAIRAMFLRT